MIRPELRAALLRHREPLAAVGLALAGLWLGTRGGWFLGALGLALGALGAGWAVTAWRRLRFARPVTDPGLVEIDEGRIGYYGAGARGLGGYVALDDLVEIRLLRLGAQSFWRLRTQDAQAILIPVAATGAEALHDAFATLPGIDMGALVAALDAAATAPVVPGQPRPDAVRSLWTRPASDRRHATLT